MSAHSTGSRPPRTEYTAPSRKNARAAPKALRDIGVEQFKRPGGTLLGAGHVRPGSAFDTLGRKKKEIPKKRRERVEVARDEVGGKTGARDEDDLDSKTGRDNDTNDPTLAPGTRGDTPGQMFTATDFDETLWGKQDEPDDATEPQEARQSNNNPALQSLRPKVVRPAPASRNLKAKAGAWGTSKLAIQQKDVVSTPVPSAADKAALIRRRLVTVKNKPTAEERFRKDYFERVKNPVIKTPKPQAPVDSPSLPGRQPPQKNQRKRRASPRVTVFSSDEDDEVDDEDEDEDVPVVLMNRHRRATTAERPQHHDRQNQKATSALPDKAVADQVSQQEDDDEEDDDDDDDDPPIVQPSRRRRVQFTSPSQSNDSPDQPTTSPLSSNSKAAAGRLLQTVKDVSSPLSDKALVDQRLQVDDDEVKEGDAPIAEHDRRHRAQPAPPSKTNNSPDQADTAPPSNDSNAAPDSVLHVAKENSPSLSDNAAVNQLLQLGAAPPSKTPDLSHIPMAQFPTAASMVHFPPTTFTPGSKAVNAPRPKSQPQPQPQTLPEKATANPPQPKRTRAATAATAKKDATPSPPRKKSRAAPKGKPAVKPAAVKPAAVKPAAVKPAAAKPAAVKPAAAKPAAKPATKPAAAKPAKTTTAAPVKKKGVAAIAGKKGVATKVIKKKPKGMKGYVEASVTDSSGSDHDSGR